MIADEPSVPLIAKFLSAVLTVSSTSDELLAMSRIDVPSSLKIIFAPPASRMISAVASRVMSAPESISAMIGVVRVLLVRVCEPVRVVTVLLNQQCLTLM